MSEQDPQVPATPAGTPAEAPAAGSQPDIKTDSPAPAGVGEPNTPPAPKPDEAQPGAGEQPQPPKPEPASPPRSRRSAQFRIEQLARENAELRKQNGNPPAPADPDEPPQPDDNPNPTDPDVDLRLKRIEKGTKLVLDHALSAEDNAELSELFSGEKASERAVYEPQIRAMWNNPQYKDLSAADAYALTKGKSLPDQIAKAKLQAVEDYKKAEIEAKNSSTGGSNSSANRNGRAPAIPSDEEILAQNEKVKAGQT